MDYKEFIERDKKARKYLDTIDIKEFMSTEKVTSVLDLMECLEEKYQNENLPEVFEGLLFNYMTEEDFAEYLRKRYGFDIWSETIEHFYIIRRS